MDHLRALWLLDSTGKPLDGRIERVLAGLLPRMRRQFPRLQDEVVITEVLEEAARRIASREERGGPIEHLHGYAWVTVRSVASSYLRRPATRVIHNSVEGPDTDALIARTEAKDGSAEQIERNILLREALSALSAEERLVCVWKKAGFSSQEIAELQGRTAAAVDTLFCRAKQKVRETLGLEDRAAPTPVATYPRFRRRA
jgi:RNA polymerase sigma factor (sigma-70 family)